MTATAATAPAPAATVRAGLSLRRNVSWAFVGNGALAATQWALVVLLTRLGGLAMVGQYALASAIAVPVMVFANMNLRGILVTDARAEFAPRHFVALRALTVIVASAVVVVGAVASGAAAATVVVVALVTIGQGVTSMQDIHRGLMQRAERMDLTAVSATLQAMTTLGAAWWMLRQAAGLPAVLVAIVVSRALVLASWDRPVARALTNGAVGAGTARTPANGTIHGGAATRRDRAALLRLARAALPVGVAMLLSSVVGNIPRYALQRHHGDVELGYFATLMAIPFAGTMVIAAFGESAAPRLGRHRHGDRRAFRVLLARLVAATLALGAAGTIVAWAFPDAILTTLFHADYAGREAAFVWVMAAGAATYVYSMLGYGVIAIGRFRAQLAISGAVAATTLVLSEWLVPPHGATGAAWAILAASTIGAVASVVLVEVALAHDGSASTIADCPVSDAADPGRRVERPSSPEASHA